jgi:hypothetical protein
MLLESVGGQGCVTVLDELLCTISILLCFCETSCYGSCDGSLLGIMLARACGSAMCDIVVELAGDWLEYLLTALNLRRWWWWGVDVHVIV